jgi:hypothetical protein
MPEIGFDDERVRDAWMEEEWRRQAQLALKARPTEGTTAEVLAKVRGAIVEALVEVFRPVLEQVVEALARIGEAALAAARGVANVVLDRLGLVGYWPWDDEYVEPPQPPPRHVNCRWADKSPLLVERVDPVRAGRTRWWTRK